MKRFNMLALGLAAMSAISLGVCSQALATETFEKSVSGAFDKDGAVQTKVSDLKDALSAEMPGGPFGFGRGRGGGDGRWGHGGRMPDNGRGGIFRRGPGYGRPGYGRPGFPRGPIGPGYGRGHRDWGRWRGHPGWGSRGRWDWRGDRPHWWGWQIWSGGGSFGCYEHYDRMLRGCNAGCQDESNYCFQNCGSYSDSYCVEQCNSNQDYCMESCQLDHQDGVRRCGR